MEQGALFGSPRMLLNLSTLLMLLAIVLLVGYHSSAPPAAAPRAFAFSGFSDSLRSIRAHHLPQYSGVTYLDWANLPIFPDFAFSNFTHLLASRLFGNTHSESPSAQLSTTTIEDARLALLRRLNTKALNYTVIFTYSAAHAMKTLVEAFPFNESGSFSHFRSADDSILALRSLARSRGGRVVEVELPGGGSEFEAVQVGNGSVTLNLVVVNLVDGFNGEVVSDAQIAALFSTFQSNATVVNALMADGSLYLQGRELDLTKFPFHAVALSFEKMFGFPNIGALIVQNSLVRELIRPYFGGGTIVYALPSRNFEKMRIVPSAKFEDGSLPFLAIAAIGSGYQLWEGLGFEAMGTHVASIMAQLKTALSGLRHPNGAPLVKVYGKNQMSILSFNVLNQHGAVVPFQTVVESAAAQDIYLVGGCHATPGTCQDDLQVADMGTEAQDPGAVRVSIGWATTEEEVRTVKRWLADEFLK
jgi:molybdenum cofactor sulfurtransferase